MCPGLTSLGGTSPERNCPKKFLIPKQKSGVEKLTRSSLKGRSNRARFAYKNGRFASRFLLLGIGFLEASKKANLSFKSPSPKPPLNRTGSVFALPKKSKTKSSKKKPRNVPEEFKALFSCLKVLHRHISQFCTRNFKHNFKLVFTTRICRHGHANNF